MTTAIYNDNTTTISADICTSACGSCDGCWEIGCFHDAITKYLTDAYLADLDYCWLDALVHNKHTYGFDYFTDKWVEDWVKQSKLNIKALDTLDDDSELDLDDDDLERIYQDTARSLNYWLWHIHFPGKISYDTWLAEATKE